MDLPARTPGTVTLSLTTLRSNQASSLVALRKRCYQLSKSFEWFDEKALEWSDEDENAVVLGVLSDSGELLSTVRLNVKLDRAATEKALMYSTANIPSRFPTMIGSRSATLPEQAKHGLAGVMRWHVVQQAKRLHMQSISGVVYDDAPRVRSMLVQGYEFYDAPNHWDSEARLRAHPILINMPAANFDAAMATIHEQLGAQISATDFVAKELDAAFDALLRRM
jgi:hypothetical protein